MSRKCGRELGIANAGIPSVGARCEKLTSVPVLLNTSFNDNEPIVCSPRDAVQTFYTSGLDDLVIGDFHISKT